MTDLQKFTPQTGGPPTVDIEVSDPIPTDSEVEKMLTEELGMTPIGSVRLKIYRKLGVHLKGHGVVETQRGRAFVSQSVLDDSLRIFHKLLVLKSKYETAEELKALNVEEVCMIGKGITQFAHALTESQELLMKLDGDRPRDPDAGEPKTPSFPAGAIVAGGNSQVHIHNPPAAGPEKPVAKADG